MRIVCSIGPRAGVEVVQRVLAVTAAMAPTPADTQNTQPELVLVHVINVGPRQDFALRFGPRGGGLRHDAAINAAEEAAGRASLAEAEAAAKAVGISVVARMERGKPEQVIVAVARDVQAAFVAIRARDNAEGHPFIGPASVGHVARFVLDHAPCDVLLIRN
jgi:nucleotide-binding universal stress UspA family protein